MKRSVHPRLMCAVFAATVAPSLHADDSRDRHGGGELAPHPLPIGASIDRK